LNHKWTGILIGILIWFTPKVKGAWGIEKKIYASVLNISTET
jgi:hypothetical protein